MISTSIRQGNRVFLDTVHYAYGFKKSGDFTIPESEILSQFGHTLLALEMGEITPESAEEERFVQVILGKEVAESKIEKAWVKYVRLSRTKRNFFTLNSSSSTSKVSYSGSEEIDDSEEIDESDLETEI